MTSQPLVIIGGGGFGRETVDVVASINSEESVWNLIGIFDDAPHQRHVERLANLNVPLLGPIPDVWFGPAPHFVIGIGNPSVRRRLAENLEAKGWKPATLIHPSAVIGSNARIEAGVIVCGGAQVSTNVHLGRHVHINPNVTVGHDAVLSDFVSVNPASIISGEVSIEEGTLVGAGAVILQGLRVGPQVVIGASACVTRSVPPHVVAKGVPAAW